MLVVDRITFLEYIQLEDKSVYDFWMKYAYECQAKDVFGVGDFMKLPFGFIKDQQYELTKGMGWEKMLDAFSILTKKTVKQLVKYPLLEICQFKNYFLAEMEKINMVESETLSHSADKKEIAAGIDRFNVLGAYLQIESLAGNDVLKIESVKKLPYETCYLWLYSQSLKADYQHDYIHVNKPA
jgi:hypothetical protein